MAESEKLVNEPQNLISDVYITKYKTSALVTRYEDARREFVENTADFLIENTPQVNETEGEMLAEELLDEVFGDLVSHIEDEGIGLWISLKGDNGKKGINFPVYTRSPVGGFHSMSDRMLNIEKEEPSESFYRAISCIVEDNEDEGGHEWGGVPEEIWEDLTEHEEEIVYRVRSAVIEMTSMTREISLLIEYSKTVTKDK